MGSKCDQCETGYTGENCDQCEEGYHRVQGTCVLGKCTIRGTLNLLPDSTCECKQGFAGYTCDHCKSGFHMHNNECMSKLKVKPSINQFSNKEQTIAGGSCDPIGTKKREDSHCICNTGFEGPQCESCAANYIKNEEDICIGI